MHFQHPQGLSTFKQKSITKINKLESILTQMDPETALCSLNLCFHLPRFECVYDVNALSKNKKKSKKKMTEHLITYTEC